MPLHDVAINAQTIIDSDELRVDFVRSSGPGGQHVNKTSSQAQLRWSPRDSKSISDTQKTRLGQTLAARLTASGELILACDRHRSRERNLAECLARLERIVREGLAVPKRRRPTRPTKSSQRRRVESKKRRSETKRLRRPPE